VLRQIMPYIGRGMLLTPQRNFKFHKTQEFRDYETLHSLAGELVQATKRKIMEKKFRIRV
jgi:hypothetical protein